MCIGPFLLLASWFVLGYIPAARVVCHRPRAYASVLMLSASKMVGCSGGPQGIPRMPAIYSYQDAHRPTNLWRDPILGQRAPRRSHCVRLATRNHIWVTRGVSMVLTRSSSLGGLPISSAKK